HARRGARGRVRADGVDACLASLLEIDALLAPPLHRLEEVGVDPDAHRVKKLEDGGNDRGHEEGRRPRDVPGGEDRRGAENDEAERVDERAGAKQRGERPARDLDSRVAHGWAAGNRNGAWRTARGRRRETRRSASSGVDARPSARRSATAAAALR